MQRPLQDLLVLDLSRILAGPWASQYLADMGAKVIKVERPKVGDDTRHWGPPNLAGDSAEQLSAYYLSANRGKQSIAIDIACEEGQTLIRDLASKSDILIENFKTGQLKKYGLDYESLKKINSGLIYCSITGFGQTGPNAQKAGYDAIIQARAGLMSLTGSAEGEPAKTGVAIADLMTGMYAVASILSAVHQRHRTGEGCYIDLALFDTQVAWLANQGMNFLISGVKPERHGNAHPNIVPYQTFAASDGYLTIAVGNDAQFKRLCDLFEKNEWANDQRFYSNSRRVEYRDELISLIEPIIKQENRAYWIEQLTAASIPCESVQTLDEVFADPQSQSRQLVRTLSHAQYGDVPQISPPVLWNGEKIMSTTAPPLLGENTQDVLELLLGLSSEQIAELKKRNVVE